MFYVIIRYIKSKKMYTEKFYDSLKTDSVKYFG